MVLELLFSFNIKAKSVSLNYMSKQSAPTRLISLHSKQSLAPSTPQLQYHHQLAEAHHEIQRLRQHNATLSDKLQIYQQKCQKIKLMEEELEFRREQERSMQQHLDHFEEINRRLREKVLELEEGSKRSEGRVDKTVCSFLRESIKFDSDLSLVDSKLETDKKSVGEAHKQNHPLTPKNRVSINLSHFITNQMETNPFGKRKIFLR